MYIKTIKYTAISSLLLGATHLGSHAYVAGEEKLMRYLDNTTRGALQDTAAAMGYELQQTQGLKTLADKVAKENNINPVLFRALIKHESNWNPFAVSKAGAAGLSQVMPFNYRRCGVDKEKLFNPETNLQCGARILSEELSIHRNPEHALMAYNGGAKCINKCKESINYAKNIIAEFFRDSL